jgi:hypothetical protein
MDTPLQYITNEQGETTAVIIPIAAWLGITNRLAEMPKEDSDLPQWQKDVLDERMKFINNPAEWVDSVEMPEELEAEDSEKV